MTRMRVTAAQILPGSPLVVGFGGWGVLGADLPDDGDHGASVGARWITLPDDAGAEIWVRITAGPETGTLLMYPDSSFEYDGTSTSFSAQLAVDGDDVGSPQPVTLTIGADPVTLAPGGAVISVTGHSPAIQQPILVTPQTGRVELTGYTPGVGQPVMLAPIAGHIEVSGNAPTISQVSTIRPSFGRVDLVGYAPGVAQPRTIAPSTGRIELSGRTPIIVRGVTINPTSGRLRQLGGAPSIAQGGAVTLSPTVGRIELSGHVPTVSTGAAAIDWGLRRRSAFVRVSRPGVVVRTDTQRAVVRI